MELEGLEVEYKREYVDNFKYSVIAFANTDGGAIYFGINDDGSVCGVQNPDETMLKITNVIRNSIRPDITLFAKCSAISLEGKTVIKLEILRGVRRPYYLSGKGIRPEGVFVRQGASSSPASEDAILQMIKESSGFVFENELSLNQNLTFEYCEKFFRSKNIEFAETQKRTLGFLTPEGTYTNLALIFSDQCPHIIKAAVFQGSAKTLFKNRKEFSGSILQQLDEAYSFLDLNNQTSAEIRGLNRIDTQSYPPESLREVLLNMIIHRDYAVQSPALISIFDDRMEFVSIGGLVPELSFDDIMLGVSVSRNKNLANVFYRLGLVESYGIGIPKIKETYAEYSVQPKIEVSTHAFKVTLPNINFMKEQSYLTLSENTPEYSASAQNTVGSQMPRFAIHSQSSQNQKPQYSQFLQQAQNVRYPASEQFATETQNRDLQVLSLFKQKNYISRKDVEQFLNTSQANAVLILRRLLEAQKIQKFGNGKNIRYCLAEK